MIKIKRIVCVSIVKLKKTYLDMKKYYLLELKVFKEYPI